MGMSPSSDRFPPGRVVIVRRGRWIGERFVVLGTDPAGRIHIADGRHRSAGSPKAKNPLHLQPVNRVIEEAARAVREGRRLDDGFLRERIAAGSNPVEDEVILGRKEVEGAAWPTRTM